MFSDQLPLCTKRLLQAKNGERKEKKAVGERFFFAKHCMGILNFNFRFKTPVEWMEKAGTNDFIFFLFFFSWLLSGIYSTHVRKQQNKVMHIFHAGSSFSMA